MKSFFSCSGTYFCDLDSTLDDMTEILFELTPENISIFNRTFSRKSSIRVMSTKPHSLYVEPITEEVPQMEIIKDPETGAFIFSYPGDLLQRVSPFKNYSFTLRNNKYMHISLCDDLIFRLSVAKTPGILGRFVVLLLVLGIKGIYIETEEEQ